MIWNFLFFIFNITFAIIYYKVINSKFEKRYINKEIIEKVKKEINALIVELNETTFRNVTVVENKLSKLKDYLKESDIKCSRLEERLKHSEKKEIKLKDTNIINAYNPIEIIQKNKIIDEKKNLEKIKNYEKEKEELDYFNSLSTVEKIEHLLNSGYKFEDIRKKLSLDEGEFEFLMNIEKINYKK